jgi:hypothetical protein
MRAASSSTHLFPSQIVAYDLETTKEATVFAEPAPVEGGMRFVSLLAIAVVCNEEDESSCDLLTTDFAGGLRRYRISDGRSLVYAENMAYIALTSAGSLSLDAAEEMVDVTRFLNETTPGVVTRYEVATRASRPGEGVFFQSEALVRPVGIHVYYPPMDMPVDEMEQNVGEESEEYMTDTTGTSTSSSPTLELSLLAKWFISMGSLFVVLH